MGATLRVLTWLLAIALVALPVIAVVNGWIGAERWPLRVLRVNDGLQQVDTARLRETVLPHAQRGFFAVRLADAQRDVARLPWVAGADVRKHWPDVLEVRIDEHRPFAYWGEDRLLSDQGRLFSAEGIDAPAGMPRLHGPDSRVQDVVALYNESRELFAPGGFEVASVTLDERGSWSLRLSNGVDIVVGSHEARLRLARFARMLPRLLAQKPQPLERADLRYTNGFALVWGERQGPETGGQGPGSAAVRSIAARAPVPSPLAVPATHSHPRHSLPAPGLRPLDPIPA
ncbi:cell division protein FtsQ/DivIB [Luteimonas sp. BDR2-5]|uniref:cell division protein FtsQ/DivIB n=1 Tax=Proluteimonas luteida TaxID=2878685 RepID=UPI001E2D2AA3|nr:cell division protein FtsQ/DivIB [Luteimonas sp. BDR2-5]MCD9027050.1 cell division protein FtsQ/DivIB [Luteimonas sp. BDR2-5]